MFLEGKEKRNEGNQKITDFIKKQEHFLENKVSANFERKENKKKKIKIEELEHGTKINNERNKDKT